MKSHSSRTGAGEPAYTVALPETSKQRRPWRNRLAAGLRRLGAERPRLALLLVALGSVMLSCYPVVFLGKSFVSPNYNIIRQLYDRNPVLPGMKKSFIEDHKGSDVGAVIWFHLPLDRVAKDAVLRDGEWPLWNRYSSGGTPLLGQGISMFGDPLSLIAWLADDASWAWDARYLIAKTFFVWGIGLLVLLSVRHLPTALLLTFSSAFIGFFGFRINHPSFFSVCYAVWILYCWFGIARARADARSMAPWLGGLLLACWAELNSGAIKEAVALIGCLNLNGLLLVGFSRETWRIKFGKLLQAAGVGLALCLLAAPLLTAFLGALKQSFTVYDAPRVELIRLTLGIGAFDELFYQQFQLNEWHCAPSLNFFALLGVLLAMAYLPRLAADRVFLAMGFGALVPAALAFGLAPEGVIRAMPFVANIIHVASTFSCPLVIQVLVLAGFGLERGWRRWQARGRGWRRDYLAAAALFGGMLALYFSAAQAVITNGFFRVYAVSLIVALLALPLAMRGMVAKPERRRWMLSLILLCLGLMHWRHGMHLPTGNTAFDGCVVNAPARADYDAPSASVDWLKARQRGGEVFRAAGFGDNFFVGYHTLQEIESISGCDPLMSPYYRELLRAGGVERVGDWQWVFNRVRFPQAQALSELLNIRYLLDLPENRHLPADGLEGAAGGDLDVYADPRAWPRAFFVERARVYRGVKEFAGMVTGRAAEGPFAAVEAEDAGARRVFGGRIGGDGVGGAAAAFDYRLTSNTTAFSVRCGGPGLAVLTEAFAEGDFQVSVDGKPVECARVNHAFKGVPIDGAGTHRIVFRYWPRRFTLSLWLAAAGLGLVGGWGAYAATRPVRLPN